MTKGLFIDCPFFEGGGAQTRNIVRRVDGAFTGTLPWDIGPHGRILRFSGTQGATLLNDPAQDLTNAFSMEALVKWDNTGSNNTIVSKRSAWSSTGIPFEITRDLQLISMRVVGNSAILNTGNIIVAGIWYHIVCTWDNINQRIYVDGVEVATNALTATVTNNAANVTIGMLPDTGEKMSGDMSHVRCWNRSLNAAEVKQLYTNPWYFYKKPSFRNRVSFVGATAYTLACSVGTFVLSGISTGLILARKLTATTSSFALTGTSTVFTVARKLTASAVSFSQTGVSAGIVHSKKLVAALTSFTMTGTATGLIVARKLTAGATSCTLSGTNASFLIARRLNSGAGTFSLNGSAAGLQIASPSAVGNIIIGIAI